MVVVTRSLGLLCSLLLVLPPGWCCAAGVAACCGKQQPVEKQEAPQTAKNCCCCPEPSDQKCNRRNSTAKPSKPAKSCCCESLPSLLTEKADQWPDLVAMPLVILVEELVFDASDRIDSGHVFVDSSPPLHVLHCVWMC